MSSTGVESNNGEKIVERPQPMRNCKPSKLNPNSVDKFRQLHETEYEARGKRSTDHVERVHRHNTAYPALRDELDRRRSISKVTAVKGRRATNLDSLCSVCLKLKRRNITKKTLKSRCRGRQNRQNGKEYRSTRCRVIYKNKKRAGNKHVNTGRKESVILTEKEKETKSDGGSVGSLKNPSNTVPSVSSYNSFPSMDHEPMV